MDNQMLGKTVLVTGGTNGIGLVTARELSRLGGKVTIIGRNASKCNRVAVAISEDTGYPVDFIVADLSTLSDVSQAAVDFKQKHTRLDVLVNNAGALFVQRKMTSDGFERTFALNHLNYFLLTNLLLDLLKASAPARIVNVSSGAHTGTESMDFDNLQGEKRFAGMGAYSQSKLANLLFTYELARRLKGSGVTVNALHPGYVDTGFAQNNGPLFKVGAKLSGRIFGRTPEEGAATSIYLASSPEVEEVSGQYFIDCKPAESSPASHDMTAAERLWQVSREFTKTQFDNPE
jgi:NAD(P)-dependent dehydrogenase (short-subunit alcohol dehydrogenase family)